MSPGPLGAPAASGFGADPFAGSLGGPGIATGLAPGPQKPQPRAAGGEDSPLLVWLAIGGGGAVLLVVVGLLIYNATGRRPAPAASTPASPATTDPSTTAPATNGAPSATTPAAMAPMGISPTGTPMTTTPPAQPAFTPPTHGRLVGSIAGDYAVWMPGQIFGQHVPLVFLPTPRPTKVLSVWEMTAGLTDIKSFSEMQFASPPNAASLDALQTQVHMQLTGQLKALSQTEIPNFKNSTYLGRECREFVWQLDIPALKTKRIFRNVLFAEGNSIFQLTWAGESETDDVKTFFASFHKRPAGASPLAAVANVFGPLAEWSYEKNPEGSSGVLQLSPLGAWEEIRTDNIKLTFEEVSRNDQFVELRDETRDVNVRLYDDRMEWKVAMGDWSAGVVGKWTIKPTGDAPVRPTIALDDTKLEKEREALKAKGLDVFPFGEGVSVSFKEADLTEDGRIKPELLEALKASTELSELNFQTANNVSDQGLEDIKDLKSLRKLRICYAKKVTDSGLAQLKGMTRLEVLSLNDLDITAEGLAHLKGLVNLKEISIGGTFSTSNTTDAELAQLPLAKVERLEIGGTKITDAGLALLKSAPQLSVLWAEHSTVSDEGLKTLAANNKKLTWLRLDDTQVTDAGLQHLSQLPGLSTLNLDGCKGVSDQGLPSLESLSNLTFLQVKGTAVTQAGAARLQQKQPKCSINGQGWELMGRFQ
jgi:hypothetical protein